MTSAPSSVTIVEVGPRDGLQNEKALVPTDAKRRFVLDLAAAGCSQIEAGSFVAPKWTPQMADSEEVLRSCRGATSASLSALTPNAEGLRRALACGVETIAIFPATTETFSRKNLNASAADAFDRFAALAGGAREAGVRVRGYISCAIHCPYEGWVAPARVAELASRLIDLGCYEVSLCDTTGAGTPRHAADLLAAVIPAIGVDRIAAHFHDTYGQGLANALTALQAGVSVFDSSAGGLGGCPYSPGATGNLATEDLVYMLNGLGVDCGIDIDGLVEAVRKVAVHLSRPITSALYRSKTSARS
jgi:hydroxymethylglutaryl-CoA lyase